MKALKMNLSILTAIMLFAGTALFSQTEEVKKDKKVVIITKTVDEDGNIQTEKIVKEGDDADSFIFKSNNGDQIMRGNVNVDEVNGEKQVRVRIDKAGGGEVEVIEWDGEGEMPANLLKTLEEKGIHMEMKEGSNIFQMKSNDAPNNACLGVMIGAKETVENINGEETTITEGGSELGVSVLEVLEASAAADAGLVKEDVITTINGTTVLTIQDLLDVLSPLEAGAVININYLRDGATLQTDATLKACSSNVTEEIEEEFEWEGEDGEIMNISGDKIIFIEKEGGANERTIVIKKYKKGEGEIVEGFEIDEEIELDGDEDVDFSNEKKQTLDLETIDIFPNPTEGKLTVQFTAPAVTTTVKIVDLSGREIYSETLNSFDGKYNKEIDLSEVAKGALILSIQQNDKVFSEKLILQR